MKRALLLLALGRGCGGHQGEPFGDCDNPPLAMCSQTALSATCPSTDDEGSRFACRDDGMCLWFTNGCVAEGFEASSCPASNICCVGLWPFETQGEPTSVYSLFYAFGTAAWDESTATAGDVTIDPSLTAPAEPFTCSADLGLGGNNPCNGATGVAQATLDDTLVITELYAGIVGWSPWIEILPSFDGYRARFCAAAFTDVAEPRCPRRSAVCAEILSVRLNRWPTSASELSGLVVTVDGVFPDNVTVRGALAVP